jgi:secreted trypsin-like serine protease
LARFGIGGLSVAFGILLAAQVQGAEPVVQPGISGADDRRPVESLAWPWRAIGRVNLRSGGYCTGTVIGADKVLTAAHCIWNQRTKAWLKPAEMYFVAGGRRGAFVAERRVVSIEIAAGRALSRGKPNSAANDWAVLILTKPVAALTGMVQVSTFTPRGLTLMLRRAPCCSAAATAATAATSCSATAIAT